MNIEEVLKSLGARNCGDYFIMYCPKCGRKEAFCYIDDIQKWNDNHKHRIPIRCNRLNKCGEVTYLNDFFTDETVMKEIIIKEKNPIQMSHDGVVLLQTYCKYVTEALHGNTNKFDFDMRGLSNSTLKKYGIIYNKDTFQHLINQAGTKKYFGDKYRHKNYHDRDIIIPIFNKEGIAERLLLRSTYRKADDYKKEIQVMLIKRGIEIWNIKDLYSDSPTLFVTEGVYDALSIKEVCPNAAVVALPGVKKYKQLLRIMKKDNIKKNIVFCFDGDEAGQEYIKEGKKAFQDANIPVYSISITSDCNDMLQNDREGFKMIIRSILMKITMKSRK